MTLALPPIGWLVILSWTVLMIFAIATADAVQNPVSPNQARQALQGPVPVGYQVIEASIDNGVRLQAPVTRLHRPTQARHLQAVSA